MEKKTNKNTFVGEQLKKAMHERGLKGRDLCKLISVTPSALSNYVNSRREPSFFTLTRIANVLDKPLEYFSLVHNENVMERSELSNIVQYIRGINKAIKIDIFTEIGVKRIVVNNIILAEMLSSQERLLQQ
jgi:transcriptional regulator with XRE-family HTH domain